MVEWRTLRTLASACLAGAVLALAGCTVGSTIPDDRDGGPRPPDAFMPDGGTDSGSTPCPAGEVRCDGVCTRLAGDDRNCGSCGNACPAEVGCAAGRCDCMAPRVACDGVCLDVSSDPANCGGCDSACGPTEMCDAGECRVVCIASELVCVVRDGEGEPQQVCVDPQTDASHCGRCNTRCAGGSVCTEGRCACPSGQVNCGGTCVDPMTDVANCGSCRTSCGEDGTCSGGRCTVCGTGLTECGGRCLDTMTDRFNCGSCARSCGTAETCSGGLCECTGDLVDCGAGCLDLMTSASDCGGCGIECGEGGVCTDGVCTCSGTLSLCSTGCRDLQTDAAHCGTCDVPCPISGSVCSEGTCACPEGMTACGDTCRNLASDAAHCSACDASCEPGEVCVASECTDVPPPANDTCATAIALSGSGTRASDTLLGASQTSSGDCGGAEVYYSVTVTQRSLVYLDTFGTSFDTRIAHRGTACDGAAVTCVDDSCTGSQSQLAVVVAPGTHFFSVHAGPMAIPGTFSLRWQVVPTASGAMARITASGTYTGTTSGTGVHTAMCETASGPEAGYWFTLCPGTTRSINASTCGSFFDTVLHVLGPTGEVACNDDTDCGGFIFDFQSAVSFSASGPGLWQVLVDGYDELESGPYTLDVTGL